MAPNLEQELEIIKWKIRFLEDFQNRDITFKESITLMKKSSLIKRLETLRYPKFLADSKEPYDYIFDMKIFDLCQEGSENLKRQFAEKRKQPAKL